MDLKKHKTELLAENQRNPQQTFFTQSKVTSNEVDSRKPLLHTLLFVS